MQHAKTEEHSLQTLALLVLSLIAVGAAVYAMQSVVLPLVLATFFATLSRPIQTRLQRFLPNSLAITLTVLLVGGLFLALPVLLSTNIQTVLDRLPVYAPRFEALIERIDLFLSGLGLDLRGFDLSSEHTLQSLVRLASDSIQNVASFMGTVVLVIFLLVFLLSEANIIRKKLEKALTAEDYELVMQSIKSMQERIQQYVTTKTVFGVLNAAFAGGLIWALGIDFPLLWTLLTFTLYFIPTFGPMIASIPPCLLALVQFDGPAQALTLLIGLILVFNILGNVFEPKFLGKALSLSPFVVFVSLLFWGWFFGLVGVILSVPLTVGIVIICLHVGPLRPLAIMLGDLPPEASP